MGIFTVEGQKDMPNPPLPVSPIPDVELEVIKDEVKLFWDQLRAGTVPPQDLIITDEGINGLIASSDYLRGHAYVKISDDEWYADLVLPADKLPGGKGRFFIGNANTMTQEDHSVESGNTHLVTTLTPKNHVKDPDFPTILKGKFVVYRDDTEEGKPVLELDYGQFLNWLAPDDWIERRENLLKCESYDHHHHHHHHDADKDCLEFMDTIARLESITIQDSKFIFKPIRNNNNEEEEEAGRDDDFLNQEMATVEDKKPNNDDNDSRRHLSSKGDKSSFMNVGGTMILRRVLSGMI